MLYNIIILIFYLKLSKCFSKNNKYGFININNYSNIVNNNNNLRSKKNAIYSKIEIKMPALSSTMTSGKIVKWNKNIGDYVNLGDTIMTVESDKADMDVEAFDEGFLRKKHVEDGSEANVGDILGILTTEENENIDEESNNDKEDKMKDEKNFKEQINTDIQEQADDMNEVKIYIPFIMSKKNKARINKWLKKENDFIKKDEVFFYVEDDKSTIEVESQYSGIIKKILINEGEFADLDKEVAIIAINKAGEKKKEEKSSFNQSKESEDEEISENNVLMHYKNIINNTNEGKLFLKNLNSQEEKMLEERLKLNFEKYNRTSSDIFKSFGSNTNDPITKKEVNKHSNMKIILPSASELIKQKKLNPDDIKDTEIQNRITYEDVDNYLKKKNLVKDTSVEKVEQKGKIIELTNIQKTIKNNMMQTLNIPVFRVTHLIKTNNLLKLYERIKHKISMSVILNKCVSNVLLKHPLIYSTYIDEGNGKILYNDDINIGNALGLKDVLLTPVLKQVNKKNIYSLSHEWKELIEKGKNGLLTANDMTGSNFYISNLGMFNTYQFDAILPKNASCILSVGTNIGSIENLEDLKIQKGMMMTLTCDHRHIYGAHAAAFMNDLSKFIENDIMDIFL
ncbi:dihydrolipoamide acyltransferase component E2, putative [Plasmodium gallinaceum]|uniref:Dihydrolipoamide acetyltransferase component of pyruvate dehydrogenase complex n=1 Tax=Plasmodium gallinaceum TaxID=5849 RepID=A0A1J1H1N1_PLAGA|nr:dihydrolipoamide acyltransferase component E2, putative [Plasmodium gallinaceum]CRG97221.1 dihydrolipoamide acyltransferase component E2, putative [Plasmodium gallinaceum]